MSMDRSDLDDLLAVVEDFADRALPASVPVDLAVARSTPLPTLVTDLLEAEVPQALAWTFEVVEAVAKRSASWGYVLACRYAAQFLNADVDGASADSFVAAGARTDNGFEVPAAPLAAGPLDALIVLDADGLHLLTDAVPAEAQPDRTGLAGAGLARVRGRADGADGSADAASAWHVLLGGVICGLGAALLRESVRYTGQREQFGAPIASFPGLRAVVGTAHAEVARARALLYAHALGESPNALVDAVAAAADAVVNCAIDAVQSMGGYGYIDEFPAAGMFRDAISLRARAASALVGWRASADLAYAHQGQVK
jgi:hypothetical protein